MTARFDKWLMLLLLPFLWVGGASLKAPVPHPFYISVTEIGHNAAEKTLEVSCKIFVDDFEETLKKQFRTAVDLSSAAQHDRAATMVAQYLQQHLRVAANGKPVSLKFLGFEKEAESVYCYFEGAGVPAVKKMEIENTILQDFTADQINILHVTVNGQRQSTRLNAPAKSASFSF